MEEAIEAGIEDILIVTGNINCPLKTTLTSNIELEEHLRVKGKDDLLNWLVSTNASNLFFVRQSYSKGLGHAILQAKACRQ